MEKVGHSDSEDEGEAPFLFESSLHAGSFFLETDPEEEVTFYLSSNRRFLFALIKVSNPLYDTEIAYYAWTSAQEPYVIYPNQGFLNPGERVSILVSLDLSSGFDYNVPEKALFFIKGLPLKEDFLTLEMRDSVEQVFHMYNVAMLFTVAILTGTVDLNEYAEKVAQNSLTLN